MAQVRGKQNVFARVVKILDEARANVVRAVNSNMVIAYWLIGREIVQAVQGGKGRAEYGKQIIEDLSQKLTQKYGRGFSITNLRYFRTFYTTYADRTPEIRQIGSGESGEVHMLYLPSELELQKELRMQSPKPCVRRTRKRR